MVAHSSGEMKLNSKYRIVLIAEGELKFMMVATNTTEKMLGIVGNRYNKFRKREKVPKKIKKLAFPNVNAKHNSSGKKMLAPFTDMRSGRLEYTSAVLHRIELAPNSRLFRSAPCQAGPEV